MMESCEELYLWRGGLDIFHEIKGGDCVVVFEVVDDKIETGFGNYVEERWKSLKRPFSISENHL